MAGLYRRGKVYWARAQRDNREQRISLKTSRRSVAEKRLRQWLEGLDAASWGDKPRRPFREATDRFIREYLPTIKRSSAIRYGVSLKNLAEHFDHMMIDQISRATMSDFETKRRTQGVTPGTIRRDLACLSSLLTSAIDWEWIDVNPVPSFLKGRAKRGLKEAPPRTRYLSEAEEARLLEHATPAVRDAMVLAIETGLRRDELFGLEWSQIDFGRDFIRTTTRTKNGRERHVPLTARARTILGTVPRRLDVPYVLVNPDTGTRYVQMNKGLKAARRRAGLAELRWHDFRRTAGCRWLQRDGKTMAEVSLLLGHSSVTVTEQRYAFLNAETVAASLAGRTKPGTGTADSNSIRKVQQ